MASNLSGFIPGFTLLRRTRLCTRSPAPTRSTKQIEISAMTISPCEPLLEEPRCFPRLLSVSIKFVRGEADRGRQSEQNAGHCRDDAHQHQYSCVQNDLVDPRQAGRCKPNDTANREECGKESKHGAHCCNQQTFKDELTHDSRTARPYG